MGRPKKNISPQPQVPSDPFLKLSVSAEGTVNCQVAIPADAEDSDLNGFAIMIAALMAGDLNSMIAEQVGEIAQDSGREAFMEMVEKMIMQFFEAPLISPSEGIPNLMQNLRRNNEDDDEGFNEGGCGCGECGI